MKLLNFLALLLIIVGALNWGLWGFFQFDIVAWMFDGNTSGMSRFIYGIIGLAGVWSLGFLSKCKAICCSSCSCKECGCTTRCGKDCSCTSCCGKDKTSGKGSGCCKM